MDSRFRGNDGSSYKTVRVNDFNRLHVIILAAHGEKSGIYKAIKVGIFKPASLCRDYRNDRRLYYFVIPAYAGIHEVST